MRECKHLFDESTISEKANKTEANAEEMTRISQRQPGKFWSGEDG